MRLSSASLVFFLFSVSLTLVAHPIPEIPVRGSFDADGTCTIRVEVDPRCFEAQWDTVIYLLNIQMTKLMSPEEREALKAQTQAYVDAGVEFFFEPQGPVKPDFTWEFTTLGGGPLVNIDDPVMVTGTWRTKAPEGLKGYSIRATDKMTFSVVYSNVLHGKPVERTAVLFPGEKSYSLQMDGSNATAAAAPPEITEDQERKAPQGGSTWLKGGALLAAALVMLWLARLRRA
jgi:hypothetical protein